MSTGLYPLRCEQWTLLYQTILLHSSQFVWCLSTLLYSTILYTFHFLHHTQIISTPPAFQHTIHCIHNSYFNNSGCQNSTKSVTMGKSIIMQNSVLCNQSIWLNGKTADLHYAKISPNKRNLHMTISILTHIYSYFMIHMKDPFLA